MKKRLPAAAMTTAALSRNGTTFSTVAGRSSRPAGDVIHEPPCSWSPEEPRGSTPEWPPPRQGAGGSSRSVELDRDARPDRDVLVELVDVGVRERDAAVREPAVAEEPVVALDADGTAERRVRRRLVGRLEGAQDAVPLVARD